VQEAVRSFLHTAPPRLLIGFASYSSGTGVSIAPTTDREEVRAAVDGLGADGGTATGDALTTVLDQLQARKGRDGRRAPAAIVLLSDGATTEGSDPVAAATRAGKLGIPIYTVALGTPDGVVYGGPFNDAVPVPPDPATLREIASRSGGKAFEVDQAGDLKRVYQRLGSKVGTRKRKRERSSAFAAGALVLLAGGMAGGLRWRPRLA
jgi:Ca-activated chloride channel family protein